MNSFEEMSSCQTGFRLMLMCSHTYMELNTGTHTSPLPFL